MMINEALKNEIALKRAKIDGNPKVYSSRTNLVQKDLRVMGDVYSFWIENPEMRNALLHGEYGPERLKREAHNGIRAIKNAWNYLLGQGRTNGFVSGLDGSIVRAVNGLVRGWGAKGGEYRTDDVTLAVPGYIPTDPKDIPMEVENVLGKVRQEYAVDPLEAAIFAHLALAMTQPFKDGNKRTARLIQDRILHEAGMPPAIIPAGEGTFYKDLVMRTAPPYSHGSKEGQQEFFDYIASKVNNGLDDILKDLSV